MRFVGRELELQALEDAYNKMTSKWLLYMDGEESEKPHCFVSFVRVRSQSFSLQ